MDITKENFYEELDNIAKNIKDSCFISFDAEFSAILTRESFKYSLFDTNEERYNKYKTQISKMKMMQVGLTMFQYDRELDAYLATGYTFHLCPQLIGRINQSLIFQASTLKFLCKHNFDFNKFIYEGLPYLSKSDEALLNRYRIENNLFDYVSESLEFDEEKQINQCSSEVSKWLSSSVEDTMYLDIDNAICRYLLHLELRQRYPGILTTDSLGNSKKILIYRDKNVEGAKNAPIAILEDNLIAYLLGFLHVIKLLETHKKPIVGHNMFLDMLFLHNQFIGPLPDSYTMFKKNINSVFPTIFDTKYISHAMSKKLTFSESWKSNALQDLYEFFAERKCKKLEYGINIVRLTTPFDVKQSYHEAGWDAYCSGYCFIRLGHWAACENRGKSHVIGPREKLAALAPYCNKVNVIRGGVSYMNFSENDPPRNRPVLLHVKCLKDTVIDVEKVASLLGSFGSIDIKPCGKRAALVATGAQFMVDKILKTYENNRDYRISKYSVYKHSVAGRFAIWSGSIVTGGLALYLIHKKFKSILL